MSRLFKQRQTRAQSNGSMKYKLESVWRIIILKLFKTGIYMGDLQNYQNWVYLCPFFSIKTIQICGFCLSISYSKELPRKALQCLFGLMSVKGQLLLPKRGRGSEVDLKLFFIVSVRESPSIPVIGCPTVGIRSKTIEKNTRCFYRIKKYCFQPTLSHFKILTGNVDWGMKLFILDITCYS